MRDIIQKSSNTDKRIMSALRRSVWLSYLLSLGTLSAGGLSIFSMTAILGIKPAQANTKEQAADIPDHAAEDEQAFPNSFRSSELTCLRGYHQNVANISGQKSDFSLKSGEDECLSERYEQSDNAVGHISEPQVGTPSPIEKKQETLQTQRNNEQNEPFETSVSTNLGHTVKLPVEISSSGNSVLLASEYLGAAQRSFVGTRYNVSAAMRSTAWMPQLQASTLDRSVTPTSIQPDKASSSETMPRGSNSFEKKDSEQLALGDKPTTVEPANPSKETEVAPTVYSKPGGASLLGGTIQAQSSVDGKQESPSPASNSPSEKDPLAPTLTLQGVYLYQGDSSARARLTGIYPISPNALVGGSLDLSSGDVFNIGRGGGLQLNELYFTGSLPDMPNLRMSVGLLDLTSYFDRNSFAKDAATHFFNPVFETNPALAAAGVASRPGILLNWDITDDLQARAAAFSSHRNLGSFALDGFAGELAYRSGNAIIRGTFATDRDAGRNDGFKEIYGIRRNNGDFGLRSGDREIAYGINGEYYIPEIKMGLFGRYGRYEDTTLSKGGDTYSLGLNFLDLFMRDDRFGFGYGRDLSNSDLRRANGNKVPDVWELFYDFRVTSYLRAGVTLQAREEFSDIVAGFRVRTDIDLLGRLFR